MSEVKVANMATKSAEMGDDTIIPVQSVDAEGLIIDLDERRLRAQGHASQLDRSFSWLGAIGLAYRFVLPFPSVFAHRFGPD